MKTFHSSARTFLTISLSLNLIFLLSLGYVFFRPNSIKQFKKIIFPKARNIKKPIHKPNYYVQKSHYENLPDTKNEIIFLGDSITDFARWSEMFQNVNIKNRGIRADRTDGVLNRLDEIVSSLPGKVFIMIGVNDLIRKRDISVIISNYDNILKLIQKKSPQTKIFVQSVLPVNTDIRHRLSREVNNDIIRLNANLKEMCTQYGINYIDLFPLFADEKNKLKKEYTIDGLHPNGKGYMVWKSGIEIYVND
jgi:lysophospholipase L1-like esterase